MDSNISPAPINHIAISVPDLDKGIHWYQKVMGFVVVRGPAELTSNDIQIGKALQNIFGAHFKRLRIVWMSSANNIGMSCFSLWSLNNL
jgi:hypothetical protein